METTRRIVGGASPNTISMKVSKKSPTENEITIILKDGQSFSGEINSTGNHVNILANSYDDIQLEQENDDLQAFVHYESFAVYDADDRREVHKITNPRKQEIASAVAGIVHINNIIYNTPFPDQVMIEGGTLGQKIQRDFGKSACHDVKFVNQLTSAAQGTAFLVESDMVATAGHCVRNVNLADWRFVFNYNSPVNHNGPFPVDQRFVIEADSIIEQGVGQSDYALVKLKAPVPGVYPLRLKLNRQLNIGDSLFVIGHPMGLPKKIADDGEIRNIIGPPGRVFECNLDTFGGNSGSPVILEDTHEVIGILVRGATDYEESEAGCMKEATFDGATEGGEQCTHIRFIVDALSRAYLNA